MIFVLKILSAQLNGTEIESPIICPACLFPRNLPTLDPVNVTNLRPRQEALNYIFYKTVILLNISLTLHPKAGLSTIRSRQICQLIGSGSWYAKTFCETALIPKYT